MDAVTLASELVHSKAWEREPEEVLCLEFIRGSFAEISPGPDQVHFNTLHRKGATEASPPPAV